MAKKKSSSSKKSESQSNAEQVKADEKTILSHAQQLIKSGLIPDINNKDVFNCLKIACDLGKEREFRTMYWTEWAHRSSESAETIAQDVLTFIGVKSLPITGYVEDLNKKILSQNTK